MKSNKLTMILSIAFFLTFSGCIVLGYMMFDQSITRAYSDSSYETTTALKRAIDIIEHEWTGLTEKQLVEKLINIKKKSPEKNTISLFKDDETNTIIFDTIEFKLKDGQLRSISYLN